MEVKVLRQETKKREKILERKIRLRRQKRLQDFAKSIIIFKIGKILLDSVEFCRILQNFAKGCFQ